MEAEEEIGKTGVVAEDAENEHRYSMKKRLAVKNCQPLFHFYTELLIKTIFKKQNSSKDFATHYLNFADTEASFHNVHVEVYLSGTAVRISCWRPSIQDLGGSAPLKHFHHEK
ncbi:MAG: hypothetical protein AAFZ15_09910 [Bacteroidota bacterium]